MAMATVRRRAVYALAVLALLCGCCSSVCGATSSEFYAVEVSCQNNEGKLSLRFPGEASSDWKECPQAVNYYALRKAEMAGADKSGSEQICLLAESLYLLSSCHSNCTSSAGENGNAVAFTMYFTAESAESTEELKGKTVTLDGTRGDLLGTSGVCVVPQSHQPATGPTPGDQPPVVQPSQTETTSSSEGTHHDGSLAGSSASTGVSPPNAAEQSGSAGPTGSQGTLTSPTGGADSSKATGDGAAQAPSASAQPSGTSTSNTPAGSDGGSATTTTTSSSPSGGKHTKGNADGSGTLTVWVRGTLLLLLTAAVACAAGE
ncbi:mucin-like glycoprotein [Trypanosoma rangeli]|uniref:Mucin-like glycoprotein n=1 Tax=Trypanosoma rangeli TaxID=5698 RepID=A0A3R7LWI5_TRYRA|nr:mucin-like glycoprotein [Trypanosoma rangeli]RNE94940.1 mucin-like glycoprotein [Trypanosoma rangeli]|eukprot:RNE94940.1 mucin-like glycoprotein [Trypanosoma rangeli]